MSDVVDLFTRHTVSPREPIFLNHPSYVHAHDFNKLVEAYNNMLHACKLLEQRVIHLENPWWKLW